jgi:hypothetical protein
MCHHQTGSIKYQVFQSKNHQKITNQSNFHPFLDEIEIYTVLEGLIKDQSFDYAQEPSFDYAQDKSYMERLGP